MKKFVWLLWLLTLPALARESSPEVLHSDKEKGEFVSNIQVMVNAPYEQTDLVLDKFVRQYKYSLDSLFSWAFTGMNLQGEQNNMIRINLKSHACDPGSDQVDGVMDLYVTILRQDFSDCTYDVAIGKQQADDGTSAVYYDLSRCDKVIDHANAQLTLARADNDTSTLTLDVHFQATLPYNLMSRKQYRDNVEWRLVRLVSNLRDEAEAPQQ